MRGRTAAIALVAAAVLVVAWIVWSPLRRTPVSLPSRGARTEATAARTAAAGDALDVHDERLRQTPIETPAPQAFRNPFRFRVAETPPPSAGPPGASRPPALVVPARPAAPAEPRAPFSLSGIAERVTEDGAVRTAVLAAPRALYHVQQGGVVLGRYRVTAITATTATLVDLETGQTFELVLKAR